ncbi:hypothetical protein IE53DRAFT_346447, partial [Violaceomyces palustris]
SSSVQPAHRVTSCSSPFHLLGELSIAPSPSSFSSIPICQATSTGKLKSPSSPHPTFHPSPSARLTSHRTKSDASTSESLSRSRD